MCEILNNSSIAAFLGAFAAFVLVMTTDYVRNLRKRSALKKLFSINLGIAKKKLTGVKLNADATTQGPLVYRGYYLPFSVNQISALESVVLHTLSDKQALAIDGICFTMYVSDKILEEIISKVERIQMLKATVGEHSPERIELIQQVKDDYVNGINTIQKVIDMLELYTHGNYDKLLSKQY